MLETNLKDWIAGAFRTRKLGRKPSKGVLETFARLALRLVLKSPAVATAVLKECKDAPVAYVDAVAFYGRPPDFVMYVAIQCFAEHMGYTMGMDKDMLLSRHEAHVFRSKDEAMEAAGLKSDGRPTRRACDDFLWEPWLVRARRRMPATSLESMSGCAFVYYDADGPVVVFMVREDVPCKC